jgi:hypothetical protein
MLWHKSLQVLLPAGNPFHSTPPPLTQLVQQQCVLLGKTGCDTIDHTDPCSYVHGANTKHRSTRHKTSSIATGNHRCTVTHSYSCCFDGADGASLYLGVGSSSIMQFTTTVRCSTWRSC